MVSGDGARRRAESDFLDFAGAHEGPALRSAALVCGDPATAERVVRAALASVAGDWREARETGPAAALRAALYPRALAAAGPDPGARPADPPPDGPAVPTGRGLDVLAAQRAGVLATLAALAPRQRAVAALRWLDERPDTEVADLSGLDAAGLRDAVDEVRRRLGLLVHGEDAAVRVADDEVRDLLELATDDLDDPALAEAAWEDALRRRRTVRRRGLVAGAVALVGGAAAVVLTGRDPEPTRRPGPTATSTGAVAGRLQGVPVDSIQVYLAPEPALEPRLPLYPDAARLALPERLGPGANRPLDILSPAGSTASVRAVFLVRVDAERVQPALFLPRQSTELQLVAMAPLRPTVDASGNTALSLGPRAVDSERRRVVFAQPGAVVVLEVRSGRTFRLPVKDDHLATAGWATDGRTIVAGNGSSGWLIDSVTGDTTRTVSAVNAGWADIGTAGGPPTLRAFAGNGRLTNLRSLDGPDVDVFGESVSNTEGWACRTVFFGSVRSTGGRMQGLMAVQGDLRPTPRILAAAASEEVPLAAYRPLAWGPRDTVLFESRSFVAEREVLRVLAWDVIENRLHRVSELSSPAVGSDTAQAFTGVWCL